MKEEYILTKHFLNHNRKDYIYLYDKNSFMCRAGMMNIFGSCPNNPTLQVRTKNPKKKGWKRIIIRSGVRNNPYIRFRTKNGKEDIYSYFYPQTSEKLNNILKNYGDTGEAIIYVHLKKS